MKQKFTLVEFEIRDGDYSYNDYAIFKKDITNMNDSEIIKEGYEEDFECDYREIIVYSIQEITKEEADTLQKFYVAFIPKESKNG
tara:strand:+ start:412 stop:666 length:255 start_codon:yes stop_codon:yes gene_type:complete